MVLHPAPGIVINGNTVIGENVTRMVGNCIGGLKKLKPVDLVLGNNVSLETNVVILGPVRIGYNVKVDAGAVVIKDAPDHAVPVDVPAVNIAVPGNQS
jgi:serine acetyltransferase